MSLRALTRLLLLDLAALVLAPLLLWSRIGPWSLLAGPGLLLLTGLPLVLLAVRPATTCWQLRYHLPPDSTPDSLPRTGSESRLAAMLRFLCERSPLVLQAHAGGLFLELPPAFDEYIQVQVPLALPEAKVLRVEAGKDHLTGTAYYLALDADGAEALRWATRAEGRQVRIHLRARTVTLAAATDGEPPPGRWLRVPLPPFAARLWRSLPVWNELSRPPGDTLLPSTGDGAVYDSCSSMLKLAPPPGYAPAEAGRILGRATDGRVLSLSPAHPLLVAGAPTLAGAAGTGESFLVQQAMQDLARGSVVVVSPHRAVLKQIRAQADVPVQWLDLENSRASARLAMATAADWPRLRRDDLDEIALALLGDLGFQVHIPALANVARRLIHVLADSARLTGHALPFTDLYAVSQSVQALRAFLADLRQLFPDPGQPLHGDVSALLDLLAAEQGAGYVQVTSLQSAVRKALHPLRAGPLHILCQPPFVDLGRRLAEGCLLLVPLSGEFVEHHRLLSLLLDLVLRRVLATAGPDFRLALHLHDPHLYRSDDARRWRDLAREDDRLSLLTAVQAPAAYSQMRAAGWDAELVFRCPEPLATQLAAEWRLPPGSAADLAELPSGLAVARLQDMSVTLTTEGVL